MVLTSLNIHVQLYKYKLKKAYSIVLDLLLIDAHHLF